MKSNHSESQVVITSAVRTPIGGFLGGLQGVSAPQLGAVAIKSALQKSALSGDDVDEVLMGCVLSAGLGNAPARQAARLAGVALHSSATAVNKMCGSGLRAAMLGCDAIVAGSAQVVVAGGMENMSRAPYLLDKSRAGMRLGHAEVLDHMLYDGLQEVSDGGKLMGAYAEDCANKYKFSRAMQDEFALESLARANKAIAAGWFDDEIAPVRVGDILVDEDEQPRRAKPEKIPHLKPAFCKDGTVTPANSSSISDGAAAMVLMSQDYAEKHKVKPLARVVAHYSYAQEPKWFTTAPLGAISGLLEKIGWQAGDVDLFEINEAFAVVTMAVMHEFKLPAERVNVHGGACALGHPIGASGARIMATLLAAMRRYKSRRGVAALCIGGGEAVAMAVENCA